MASSESTAYRILREAIIGRRSLRTNYGDYVRLFCPYMPMIDVVAEA